jgi:hypothetical protein
MAISVCPDCDNKLRVPDGAQGKKIRCPACENLLLVTARGLKLADEEAVTASRPTSGSKNRASRDDDDDDRDDDDRPSRVRKKKSRSRSGGGIPLWVWLVGGGGLAAVLVGVLLFFLLSGGSDFSKVKKGMTEEEVTKLVGKPDHSLGLGGSKFCTWVKGSLTSPSELLQIQFQNGKAEMVRHRTAEQMKSDFNRPVLGRPF